MAEPTTLTQAAPVPSHAATVSDVVVELTTDQHHGLSQAEATRRLERHGPNTLPAAHAAPLAIRVLQQLHNPLIYVLLVAAATTVVLRDYVDASVILAVVLVNALVGFIQESKALAALDGLRSMTHARSRVVRGGLLRATASEELVPGDLVAVEAGEKITADLRIVDADDVRVDESALTGESDAVLKEDTVLTHDTRVADRRNSLHAGTLVRTGSARGIVVATGQDTELGGIHRLVSSAAVLTTPLTSKLARFSTNLAVVITVLAALAFATGLLRGEDATTMFTAAVALAVGAIPEGLPAAVTVTLAIGVKRLAGRRAIVRRLPAVETLGSTTVVCTDKTGTLTTNQMTVQEIWTPQASYDVSGTGYDPDGEITAQDVVAAEDPPGPVAASEALRWSVVAGTACNESGISREGERWVITGDPTEAAMKVVALKWSAGRALDEPPRRVAAVPFDSNRQYMATLHEQPGQDEHVALVKGAVERVVALCSSWMRSDGTAGAIDRPAVDRAASLMAARGLRVLATAVDREATPDSFAAPGHGGTLVLTGLQAMLDPPRPAAAAAIAACHTAGIQVKMITGDHAATAAAIAADLGLDDRPAVHRRVLTGADLSAMSGADHAHAVDTHRVFARVAPEEKLRLVEALQARGHVVAMTGDGVNDAPALRRADIGVAMGLGGTEVAKDAADMILVDDDFATIEAAIEEGRGVFDNLTKFIVWTLPTNIGEGLVILAAILWGTALPILPTQILWINMTTAVVLGLSLAFEPREPGIMTRPPRDPDRPLVTGVLIWRTALVASLLVAAAWWIFTTEQARGVALDEARTAAVNVFVAVEIAYLVSCRSLTRAAWRLGPFTNRWLVGGVTLQVVAQAAFTYTTPMNDLFGTAPLDGTAWLRILVVAAVVSVVVAADKAVALRRAASSHRAQGSQRTGAPSSR